MKLNNFKSGVLFAVLLIGLYFVTRYGLSQFYTPEWGARRILGFVSLIIFVPAVVGRVKFSTITFLGYILGLIAGELFGKVDVVKPYFYDHYGWLILIVVFTLSCGVGWYVEYDVKRKR